MTETSLLVVIKDIGNIYEAIELFFVGFTNSWLVLFVGIGIASVISLLFYFITRTTDWLIVQR